MARHFTKDEIEEIRVQLATKAVRDSELPAAETVYDNDEVAIVQAGSNKRLSVTTLEEHIREPFASDEQTRQANEVARKKAEGQFGSGDPDYATSRVKKESDRQAAESVRQEQEEIRQRGESDRNTAYATAEGTKSGSTASDGSRWGEYKAAENARNAARLAAEGTIESLADDGTRWGEYKEAEEARDIDRAAQEGSKSSSTKGDGTMWGEYKQAESDRDDAYAVQEGTSSSSAGNSSRWAAYKTAEAARNTARETVEGSSSSTAGDGTRWGAYKTAEANRDTARQTAEGSALSTAGDGSRWGAYKTAEADRDTARQTAEGTSSSTAGDGTRWGAYKTAEASRGTAYTTAEGTSSASAGDANRWGAYKTAEAARGTAYEGQEGTSSSTAGDGTRWGAYKTAEAERSAAMNAKADKDADAVEGNIAAFDASGNPVDSGIAANYISQLGQEVSQLQHKVDGLNSSKDYEITQGAALSTTAIDKQFPIDLNAGDSVEVTINYPSAPDTSDYIVYLMNGSTNVLTDSKIKNKTKRTLVAPSKVTGIAFYILQSKAIATDTVTLTCLIQSSTKRLENEINELSVEIENKPTGRKSTNLFDKSAVTLGYYLNVDNGGYIENSSYFVSDFIPVTPGNKYIASILSFAAYFDKNKNWLVSAGASNPNTAPSNAAYLRLSGGVSALNTFQVNAGDTLLPYEPYVSFILDSAFDENALNFLRKKFGINYLQKLREHLDNPFIPTQIKLLGDSITAGQAGTGYSATGETITGTGSKANVLTATCWSNMLYHYVDSVYNKDTEVEVNDERIKRISSNASLSKNTTNVGGVIVYFWQFLYLNNVAGNEILSFSFYGDHFSLRVVEASSQGIFKVFVDDNEFATVDCYSSTTDRLALRNFTGLSMGQHDVSLVSTNTKNTDSSGLPVAVTGFVIPKHAVVKPWGISGTDSSAPLTYLTSGTISVDDDFIFLQYGTNDRHTGLSPDITYTNLVNVAKGIINNFNAIPIFMCAPPCATNFEDTGTDVVRYYHMWDVHDATCRAAAYFDAPIIDNYTAFQEYAEQHNINTDALLADGLHPNDLGYKVIFMNIMKSLGLARLPYYLEWLGNN